MKPYRDAGPRKNIAVYCGLPEIRILRFRAAHLDRIMEIERASFGRLAYSRGMFRELHERCGRLFFTARRGRGIAGYIVACAEAEEAEVVSIAVDPAARGSGAGKALMRRLLDELAATGATRVSLMVRTDNLPAIRFYRGFGFRRMRVETRYYEDGTDAYLMRRLL